MTGPSGDGTTLATKASDGRDEGIGAELNELLGLVVAYAKQETVVPIKNLGRFLLWGLLGGILFAIGAVFASITAIRVVQTETGRHLHGNLSWVPYGAGALVAVLAVSWAAMRVARRKM